MQPSTKPRQSNCLIITNNSASTVLVTLTLHVKFLIKEAILQRNTSPKPATLGSRKEPSVFTFTQLREGGFQHTRVNLGADVLKGDNLSRPKETKISSEHELE